MYNTGSISGQDNDTDMSNNISSVPVTFMGIPPTAPATGDLIIQKTVDSPVPQTGDTVIYTINYINSGSNTITGISIVDPLPSGLNYASAIPAPDTISGQTLTWNIGTMTGNTSGSISINATIDNSVTSGAVISNSATISGTITDLDSSSNTSTVNITVIGGIPPAVDPVIPIIPDTHSIGFAGGGMGVGSVPPGDATPNPVVDTPIYGAAPLFASGCIYHDGNFELYKTSLRDIQGTIFQPAVDLLLDHCVIQGYGNGGKVFAPYAYIQW